MINAQLFISQIRMQTLCSKQTTPPLPGPCKKNQGCVKSHCLIPGPRQNNKSGLCKISLPNFGTKRKQKIRAVQNLAAIFRDQDKNETSVSRIGVTTVTTLSLVSIPCPAKVQVWPPCHRLGES